MKQLSLQSEYVLQQKDSDIQKETEKYSLSKTKQKIKHKKIVAKVKLQRKEKNILIVVLKQPIFLVQRLQ